MITKETYMNIWSLQKQGLSQRSIARKLGISRNSVSKYLELGEIPAYPTVKRKSKLQPFYQMIQDWLAQDDYTATRIHDLLVAQGFEGSYDVTRRYVQKIKREQKRLAYVRFETMPGLQAQVDFADFKVKNHDGTEKTFYCFSMVMGFSRHMYLELVNDCKMPTFLDCHIRAFEFFGGIPAELVYDNLKNVVLKHIVGQVTKYNQTFLDFACHYRFKPQACSPYAGWEKGKVERPFYYVRERFWRGYPFETLNKANRDLRHWLQTVAFQRVHGSHKEVVSVRFGQEKPKLGDIPRKAYDTSEKFTRKVYKDCQISFQGNYYVVPHEYVGERVLVKYKHDVVTIFHDENMLAIYKQPQGKGQIIQNPEFYARLKEDRELRRRKYMRPVKSKGKAVQTAAMSTLLETVEQRALSYYDALVAGGEACLN